MSQEQFGQLVAGVIGWVIALLINSAICWYLYSAVAPKFGLPELSYSDSLCITALINTIYMGKKS